MEFPLALREELAMVAGVENVSGIEKAQAAMSVTQLVRRMKNLLEIQLGHVWVEGEVSNLRRQASGHWYFSLKDEGAQISCVMFGAKKREGAQAMDDGARVRVLAEASVYEARGQLQIIVTRVEAAGVGDLQRRFEELKRKLQAEGLFDAERKKAIPAFPRLIGLVTSGSGAALQDMLNVLGRRAPWVQPVLFPVRVQGKGAEREIAEAIRQMGEPERFGHPRCDVLIVGRGGGSLEDLWNFNEELVARAIAACPIPVISAVGHEIDFTIADFVADLRAPTPSAAAELAVTDGAELSAKLRQLTRRLAGPVRERLERAAAELQGVRRGISRRGADSLLRELEMRVDGAREELEAGVREQIADMGREVEKARAAHRGQHPARVLERRQESTQILAKRMQLAAAIPIKHQVERLERLAGMVRALGPESAFQRGFSITTDGEGRIVRSSSALRAGDVLVTKFADGAVRSEVVRDGVLEGSNEFFRGGV
jgi:exodeoxyribonuclease VII large subunit